MSTKVSVNQVTVAVLKFPEPLFIGNTVGPIAFQVLDSTPTAIDLDGSIWYFALGKSGVAYITKVTNAANPNDFPVDVANKRALLTLFSTDTAELSAGTYNFDIQVKFPAVDPDVVWPVATGTITFSAALSGIVPELS